MDGSVFLKLEDVVENAVDAPALEAVIGHQPGVAEYVAEAAAEAGVDPRLPPLEGILEEHQAGIQHLEPMAAVEDRAHGA